MAHRRIWRLALGVSVLVVLGSTPAHACVDPHLALSTDTAGPGDPVGYSISNTQPGAHFTITIGSVVVADGTDPGGEPGLQGTFTMPDLGEPASQPAVGATVEHPEDGADYPSTPASGLQYTGHQRVSPPPASTPPAPQQPAPEPSAPPVEIVIPHEHGVQAGGDGDAPADPASASVADQVGTSAGSDSLSRGAQSAASASDSIEAPSGSPRVRTAVDEPGTSLRSSGSTRGGRTPSGVPEARRSLAGPSFTGTVGGSATQSTIGRVTNISGVALAVGLLAALAAMAVASIAVIRRRRGPGDASAIGSAPLWMPPAIQAESDWRSALIEAELQEILAEERAKALLSPAQAERTPRSSEAGSRPASIA